MVILRGHTKDKMAILMIETLLDDESNESSN